MRRRWPRSRCRGSKAELKARLRTSPIAPRAGIAEAHSLRDAYEDRAEEFDPRLVSREQGIEYRGALIGGAIRGLLPRERPAGQPEDALVFDGGDYYVQILVRPETLQIYAEAVDLDGQGLGLLSDSQRELLEQLGWERGGGEDATANYHRILVGGTPEALVAETASVLEYTLRLVYGAGAASPLRLSVITYDRLVESESNDSRE